MHEQVQWDDFSFNKQYVLLLDLVKVLPKLAKRLTSNSNVAQSPPISANNSTGDRTPLPPSSDDGLREENSAKDNELFEVSS